MSICILCGDDVLMDDPHDCRRMADQSPGFQRMRWLMHCDEEMRRRKIAMVYPYEYPNSEHSAKMAAARTLTDEELAQCMEAYLAHERFSRSEALRKAIEAADRIRGLR